MAQTNCVVANNNLSNTVTTQINHAQISSVDGGLNKTVDRKFADIGDTLTYTISLNNTGNTPANNIIFQDTVPVGTSLVPNSVTLNGVTQPGANPNTGFGIGVLNPNQVATVTFQVTVGTNPNPNPNPKINQSNISYQYTADPSFPNGASSSNTSNSAITQINHAQISPSDGGLIKLVSRQYADVGNTITYTVVVKNTGSTTANNVVVTDTIPGGTAFVTNSVVVNGSIQPGANPQSGVNIGNVGKGSVSTLVFQVTITTIPTVNPIPNNARIGYSYIVDPCVPRVVNQQGISNTTNTQVNNANIPTPNKSVQPAYADIGDTVTYTVVMQNTGNVPANNVILTDSIPNGTQLIPNSVVVNNVTIPGANPQTGINVGTMNPGSQTNVQFSVKVYSIPNPNPIKNIAQVNYTYTTDPSIPNGNSGGTNTTPSINTVNNGQLSTINNGIFKSATPTYVSIGDTITYTLKLTNTGNVPVNNVIVYDTIPSNTTIVPGSVQVNNTVQATANIQTGLSIGSINSNQTTTVTFLAVVTTLPNQNPIINNFDTSYTYTVDPSFPNGKSQRNTSNNAINTVNDAIIGKGPNSFLKTPDKKYADIGDTVTYTIVLGNTGNVPGNNVMVFDTIPNGTQFVGNSVTVNGQIVSGANPQNGIGIGTMNPGQVVTTTFKVIVVTIPNPNPIQNQAAISYTYTKDPSVPNGSKVNGTSNIGTTQVNHGRVPQGGFVKTSNTQYVKRGDVVTYTFSIPNTGNVAISNVVIYDTIPSASSLVPGSVTVNSVAVPGANPNTGVAIGTIPANGLTTVTYQVVVNSIPQGGVLVNQGTLNYSYIVDPSLPPVKGSTNSNQNNVNVNDARISNVDGGFVKTVVPQYAQLGDTITYTLFVKNTGNVTATNVVITDTIPQGSNFINNSVNINGTNSPNANPQQGITIAALPPNMPTTITFQVIVTSIPANNQVINTANVSYQFKVNPNSLPISATGNTNQVITNVNSVNFSGDNFKKQSTPKYAAIGDTITYSFNINNTGNIQADNVTFIDTIPQGTAFVPNSVMLNSVTIPGANPSQGVNLQSIAAGAKNTLSFQVVVTSIPVVNPIPDSAVLNYTSNVNPNNPPVPGSSTSNTVYNQVNSVNMQINKSSNPSAAVVGETVTYTLQINNTGNVPALNAVIEDMLPPQLQFVQGSVTIAGKADPTKNIVNGISLGTIVPNQPVSITYKAVVLQVPTDGIIRNQATSSYQFVVDPSLPPRQGNTPSNINQLPVGIADLSVVKVADKTEVVLGDVVGYVVTITNTGTLVANNINVTDLLQTGAIFVPNSFTLNGVSINGLVIQDGFNIGSLAPGASAILQYQVKVERVCGCCKITNAVEVKFSYQASAQSQQAYKLIGPISTTVTAVSPAFKQFNLDAILVVPCPKPDIQEVSNLDVSAIIQESHIIQTIKGTSAENLNLTGYKLVVNGILQADLEYISDKCESMNMAAFERKFSTYIVLPEDIEPMANVELTPIIEDVYFRQLNCREVFMNITLLLKAQVSC